MAVRRLLALVLANALAASSATAALLHVHEYSGHDHPEHHHGLAAHSHRPPVLTEHHGADEGEEHHPAVRVDSCDPGQHAVAVTMGCAQVPRVHVDVAELAAPTLFASTAPLRSTAPITDVRVHGPPCDFRFPSRAPPLTSLA